MGFLKPANRGVRNCLSDGGATVDFFVPPSYIVRTKINFERFFPVGRSQCIINGPPPGNALGPLGQRERFCFGSYLTSISEEKKEICVIRGFVLLISSGNVLPKENRKNIIIMKPKRKKH